MLSLSKLSALIFASLLFTSTAFATECKKEIELTGMAAQFFHKIWRETPKFSRLDPDVSLAFDKAYSAAKSVPPETNLKEILAYEGSGETLLFYIGKNDCGTIFIRTTPTKFRIWLNAGKV